ncbi:hypothetical protein DI005_16195 [Prauserella sp. PE36]|uniref:hypothetical protein n=1 Tax=Prauserella sp. PE36 TaxID=1504709 RepID=UPI000DE3EC19|nr:hypothetical protein [Prauserella sp. PE36]RBM19232.1 hypothetical protein DI005_16195 [Prauserella sp. PE36]
MDDDLDELYDRLDQLVTDLSELAHRRAPCPDHLPESYWSDYTARIRSAAHGAYELVWQARCGLAEFETEHDIFMQQHGIDWR